MHTDLLDPVPRERRDRLGEHALVEQRAPERAPDGAFCVVEVRSPRTLAEARPEAAPFPERRLNQPEAERGVFVAVDAMRALGDDGDAGGAKVLA
mgnify:CR=1 FL=1